MLSTLTSINATKARQFWEQKDRKESFVDRDEVDDVPVEFKRGSSFRSSGRSSGSLSPKDVQNWSNIYCTIRERKRARSSSGASQSSGVSSQYSSETKSPNTSSTRTTPSPRRSQSRAMSEETLMTTSFKTEPGYYAPKRYQMTCYLKPKTIPVWYTTTIVMKINSTAKKYTEKAYFERKLVPFYYSESMKTLTAATKPPQFVATLEIPRDVPDEHWISLEHQQSLDCNKCVQSLFVNDSTALAC